MIILLNIEEYLKNFFGDDLNSDLLSYAKAAQAAAKEGEEFTLTQEGLIASMQQSQGPVQKTEGFIRNFFNAFKSGGTAFKETAQGIFSPGKDGVLANASAMFTQAASSGKSFISTFWSALSPFNKFLIIGAAVATVIGLVAKSYDEVVHRLDNAKEKTADAIEHYESLTSEVESLEEQLDSLNKQIEGMDPITDKDELSLLEQERELLEQQLTILKEKQKIASDEADKAAQESLGITTTSKYIGEEKQIYTGMMQTVFVGDQVTQQEELDAAMEAHDKYLDERQKLLNKQEELAATGDYSQKEWDDLQSSIDEYDQKIADTKIHANELASAIMEQTVGLNESTEASKKAKAINEASVKYYKMWIDAASEGRKLTKTEKQLKSITSYFDGTKSKNAIQDRLYDTAKAGKDVVIELNRLGISLEDLGLQGASGATALRDYFNELVSSATNASEAVSDFNVTVSDVASAFETENQGSDWDSMAGYIEQANELYKQGLIGTDEFQTAAQWLYPDLIDTDKYELDSEAFAAAWKEKHKLVKSWFDEDNPLESMWSFVRKLEEVDIASIDGNDITMEFETTAEAAKKLGVNVQVVDTLLHKLEEYGFEFEGIEFSGDLLSEYEKNLENIKKLYNSLPSGSKLRKNLEELIKGFDSEYTSFQEDLSLLDEKYIIEIEFQYSIAQLEAEIEELEAKNNANPELREAHKALAALNVRRQQVVDSYKEQTGYVDGSDLGLEEVEKKIDEFRSEISTTTDEQLKISLQNKVGLLLEFESEFLKMYNEDNTVDWFKFLDTKNFEEAISELAKTSGYSETFVREFITSLSSPEVKTYIEEMKEIGETADNLANRELAPEINPDTTYFYSETDKVNKALDNVDNKTATASVNLDTIPYTEGKQIIDEHIAQLEENPIIAKLNLEDNVSEKLEEINEAEIKDKSFFVKIKDWASSALTKIKNTLNGINDKEVTVTTRAITYKNTKEQVMADGTFQAHAQGTNVSINKPHKAVVNELGNEGIVRDGVLHEIQGGAQVVNLKRGDIIFNHKQMEELKENGKITFTACFSDGKISAGYDKHKDNGRRKASVLYEQRSQKVDR